MPIPMDFPTQASAHCEVSVTAGRRALSHTPCIPDTNVHELSTPVILTNLLNWSERGFRPTFHIFRGIECDALAQGELA